MIERQSKIPAQSILKTKEEWFDYVDRFQSSVSVDEQSFDIEKLGTLFLTSGPRWGDQLMKIRNKIVGMLGIKTSAKIVDSHNVSEEIKYKVGEKLGIFKVYNKTDHELLLGEDDQHLNFRVSLLVNKNDSNKSVKLMITTMVKFNNLFGRVYFLFVKPFHQLIVSSTLKEMVRRLEAETTEHDPVIPIAQ